MTDIDLQALMFIQENIRVDWLNPIMIMFTNLGSKGLLWIILLVCLCIYPKTRRIGIVAVISFALCAAVTLFLAKGLIMRPRPFTVLPELIPLIKKPDSFSFPSGHTVVAFAVAFVIWRSKLTRLRYPIMLLAVLMGFSRLYVGVHYPTDVLGAVVLAFVGSSIVWAWAKRYIYTD